MTAAAGPFQARFVGRSIVSLLLAFGLWFVVADDEGTEVVLSGPLELRNVPTGLEIVDQSVREVAVRLRGDSGLLGGLPGQALRIHADLAGATPGERTVFLGPDDVEVPSGIRVMRVDPSRVVVRLEPTIESVAQVSPRVLGAPAAGLEIHRLLIEPREVVLEGPETLVRSIQQVTTEPISVEGLRETYARRLQIQLDPALRTDVRTVDVVLEIGPERAELDLALPVRLVVSDQEGEASPACTVAATEVAAVLRVPPHLAERAATGMFAEVSCDGLPPGTHAVAPSIVFPAAPDAPVGVTALDPERIEVVVGDADDGGR